MSATRTHDVCAVQEWAAILRLHDNIFSSDTGDLKELQLAGDPSDTLWAAAMVNSRCFSDVVGDRWLTACIGLVV